jgi:HSP20 family protein
MPFFIHPQAFHPQPTFNPLLDLLREASRDSCQPRQRPVRTFTPKFDITESATTYELYGELAGVQPQDVTIEFTDRQTLTIRGRRERQTSSVTTPSTPSTTQETSESHKATVEDDFEEINAAESDAATTSTAQNTESTATEEKASEKKSEDPKPRYWIAERGVGQFSRSFEFQEGIDQEGVKASFNNGVLSIVVPKKPFESRKVAIN